MRQAKELTNDQKKFIEDNWQRMTFIEIADKLDLKSNYKVYEYANLKGLKRQRKEFSDHEKQFIRNNYLKMKESEMTTMLGCTRFYIQQFKRSENLIKKGLCLKASVKEVFFNVDARESWVA